MIFFAYPLAFLLILLHFSAFSQFRFRVDFTDKNNSPYSVLSPSQFLSQRAVNRRTNQTIFIAENDLPVNQNYIDSILNSGNIQLLNRSKWLNSITISSDDSTIMDLINTFSFVKKTERYKKSNSDLSQKKLNPDKGREGAYGAALNQTQMIHIDSIHSLGFRGKGMLIAVLDAGFISTDTMEAFGHLYDNNRMIATKNFVDGTDSVYKDATHGTYVLSTMAAVLPGLITGTAPEANYMLLLSEDMASETIIEEFNWVAAAEFADSAGADVINSSLGYTTFDNNEYNHTYAEMDGNTALATIGADIAASKGILVVNSAGNSGSGAWNFIGVPADGDSVLAIGAVDANRKYASFSSNGPSYDGRVKPDVSAQGSGTVIASLNDSIGSGSGTSFSSPVIAGAAACLWQSFPGKTSMEIFYAIRESASQHNNPDTLLGYGIPNFVTAYQLLNEKKIIDFINDTIFPAPNPFSEKLLVNFYSTINQAVTIELFNTGGELIFSSEKKAIEGLNEYFFYPDKIASKGVYFLRVITQKELFLEKIVKI